MRRIGSGPHALLSILLAFLATGPVLGQMVESRRSPLSRRYQHWLEQRMPRGTPAPAGGSREGGLRIRGYVPAPLDLSQVHGPIFSGGPAAPVYPAFYDLRAQGLLTPVKDQGEYGTCWSFACIGSLESSLLRAGLGAHDLSEWHLAWYAYTPFNDSLLTAFTPGQLGAGEDPVFDQGGSDWMSTAILGRGTGPVAEQDCPYQIGGYKPEPRPAGDLPNGRENLSVPLEGAWYLFNGDTPIHPTDIKYALTHYGPTVIAMDYEDPNFDPDMNTYRDPSATEYDLNHEVCIVGWDDTFATCRFPANNRPAQPGAWIVRNSWSRYWGQNGYFYLSYDSKVFDGTVFLGGPRRTRRIYQYDPLGWVASRGFGTSSAYCANVFRAQASERITAVACYAGVPGTRYEISIRPGNRQDSARRLLAANPAGAGQQGTFQAPGFHVVDLIEPVAVQAGYPFAVVIKLTTPGYEYPIPVQDQVPGYSDHSSPHHDRSFISPDGSTWQDLAPTCAGAAVCVKAYAEPD